MRRIDLKKAQAARSNTIRDINRQIVLNYVREREPISRAEIARETALQRSTVSTIVEQLQSDGLVEEVGAGESTGGRRPTMLRLRAAGAMAIGVDIAPTVTTIASSDLAGRVLQQDTFETSADFNETVERIIEHVEAIVVNSVSRIEGIGVSVPGLVDTDFGSALYVPYFKWRDLKIGERLLAATGIPVVMDNDANALALAELWFGRPEIQEVRDFIMVLVEEGVGTGIVFDGQVYRGEHGAAGEFGHMIIGQDGPVACSCGNFDCWEAFSSGRAAVARYVRRTGEGAGTTKLNLDAIVDRALASDADAEAVLIETANYLGIGISNLVVGFSPEAVVVGGPLTRVWPLISEALNETIERSIRRGLPSAPIIASTLGGQPTLMGALSLVLAGKFSSILAV
jgi:predicted NBD/HSP70 family sugar kinase